MKTLEQIIKRAKAINEDLEQIDNEFIPNYPNLLKRYEQMKSDYNGELKGLFFASGLSTVEFLRITK